MKLLTITRRAVALAAVLGGLTLTAISCKDNDSSAVSYGTVSGIVTDSEGVPVEGVRVTVSDTDGEVLTAADGSYTFAGVSSVRHAVIASKEGYLAASKTVTARSFIDGVAKDVDMSILYANTTLSGRVLDQRSSTRGMTRALGAPLQGVVVQVATGERTTTDAEGYWELKQLAAMDHVVTFTYNGYPPVKVNVPLDKQVNESFEAGDIYLGGSDLLADFDRYELAEAPLLFYDDYRAGNWGSPFGDWSTSNMPMMMGRYGNTESQWEGFALRPTDSGLGKLPNDLDNFDTFLYGRKKITPTNSKLVVRVRCHQAPATFGVSVVDLNAPNPEVTKMGTWTHPNDGYADYKVDLAAYEGKEVLVVVGQYIDYTNNSATATDYWHQLPVSRIAFSSAYIDGGSTHVWPGTEVIPGWALTKEMVANTAAQSRTSFTGIPPEGAGNDPGGINRLFGTNHLAAYWHNIAVDKDIEPLRAEGYIMKTNGDANHPVSTTVPESFIYAKFNIAEGANKMRIMARTIGNPTASFFKFAAFDENGNLLNFIAPQAGAIGEAAPDNTWKFAHDNSEYKPFDFDLSAYNGRAITVVFAVFKGESNGDENKLVIYNIELQ